ncbi:acyl-CoA dehydrogenase family protein [Micromonospora sp. SL1-18]|uniref:acyl-CoA dehydrogenase family protein n=1 Tax=Micromonospora sp. SL1-18 TaxID=3399128 RepID=UPI003A4DE403
MRPAPPDCGHCPAQAPRRPGPRPDHVPTTCRKSSKPHQHRRRPPLTSASVDAITIDGDTRIAVGTVKVVTARALHAVVDHAIQVHGAEGLTDDTPLPALACAARIPDGPDELHITTVTRRLFARTP